MASHKTRTIIVSGNLPIHCKDGKAGFYAPSYSSMAATMLYGTAHIERDRTVFIGIGNPEGMPQPSAIQPGKFTFVPVSTTKRPKDLVFSRHLSQACHHALGKNALFPEDLERPYNDYVQFNKEFFDALKTVYSPKDTIIILGKHLLMLPSLIRADYELAKICLIYLCPFPPYELFSCIPYSSEVLRSLMACDKVELQNSEYLENFISTAFLLLNTQHKEVNEKSLEMIKGNSSVVFVEAKEGQIEIASCKEDGDHLLPCTEQRRDMLSMLTTAYKTEYLIDEKEALIDPINIDEDTLAPTEYLEDVLPVVSRLQKADTNKTHVVYAGHARVLLSVTPKHVPKEFLKKMQASSEYEEILGKLKEAKKNRKLVLVVETTRKIGAPIDNLFSVLKYLKKNPDTDVDFIRCILYGESTAFHNTELSGIAERIASLYPSRFSTIIFPSSYLYCALLKVADVCLAGSPSDSLSLAANEYAEVNPTGKLIVPYSSGIAFSSALYTLNCPEVTSEIIAQALSSKHKNGKVQPSLLKNTEEWIASLHHILRTDLPLGTDETGKVLKHMAKNILTEKEKIKKEYLESEERTFFLDYDGTLTDIVLSPKDAKPTEEILSCLRALCTDSKNRVFIVTGRSKEEAEEWFSGLNLQIYAEHGTYKKENGKWKSIECDLTWMPDAIEIIKEYVEYTPGSHIEIKNTCVVFHCQQYGKWCANALQRMLGHQARVVTGKNIIEVRSKGIDKGSCIEKEVHRNTFTLCAGDDATDEDMFMVLLEAPKTHTVCIGEKTTCASIRAQSPKDLRDFLNYLHE